MHFSLSQRNNDHVQLRRQCFSKSKNIALALKLITSNNTLNALLKTDFMPSNVIDLSLNKRFAKNLVEGYVVIIEAGFLKSTIFTPAVHP